MIEYLGLTVATSIINHFISLGLDRLLAEKNAYKSILADVIDATIEECKTNIENFNSKTALNWLKKLEKEIEIKSSEVASSLKANLWFVEALCSELLGQSENSWKFYIKATTLINRIIFTKNAHV